VLVAATPSTNEVVELEHWEPSPDVAFGWLSITLILAFPVLAAFGAIAAVAAGGNAEFAVDAASLAVLAALTVGVLALHEAVHGAAILAFGRRPTFGAGLLHGLPYLSTTANALFRRDEFVAIAIAPLPAISAAGIVLMFAVPGWAPWLVAPLAFNALGAVGDLNLALVTLRYPRRVLVSDERTGIRVVGHRADRRPPQPVPAAPDARRRFLLTLVRALPIAVLATLLAPLVVVALLSAAGIPSVDVPGVLKIESAPTRVTVGFFLPVLLAIAAAAISLASTRRRARE
jgi:putative zincin peptidase